MSPSRGRGIDVLVGIGVALLTLQALALLAGGVVVVRRFGAQLELSDPRLGVPLLVLGLTLVSSVYALLRRRSEGVMAVCAAACLVVFVAVPGWFLSLIQID